MKNKFYTREVKLKAVEMKLAGVSVKKMMTELNTRVSHKCIRDINAIEMENSIVLISQ